MADGESPLSNFLGMQPAQVQADPNADVDSLIAASAAKYGVDPALVRAHVMQESSGNPNATGQPTAHGRPKGAGQLMPATAAGLGVTDAYSAPQNIDGAAKLIAQNLQAAGGDVPKAIAMYIGGPDPKKWGPNTNAYQAAVLAKYQAAKGALGGGAVEPAPVGGLRGFLAGSGDVPAAPPASGPTSALMANVAGAEPAAAEPAPDGPTASLLKNVNAPDTGLSYDNGEPVRSVPQAQTFKQLWAVGALDPQAPHGSIRNPYGEHDGREVPAGAWYVDQKTGAIKQMPGAAAPASSDLGQLGESIGQGVRDVNGSLDQADAFLAKHLPGYNALEMGANPDARVAADTAARDRFNGAYSDNPLIAPVGRLGGQIAASLPIQMAGGALASGVSKAIPAVAPVMNFLAGKTVGNPLLSTTSRAVSGAASGGEGAALTSSSSDTPLAYQVGAGALTGGALGPVLGAHAAGAGTRVTPEVQDLADMAINKYGIPLRTSQILGTADRNAAIKDSELISAPGSGYAANHAQQAQAFTRAASKSIGEDSPVLTAEVMDRARTRIGSVFDAAAASTGVRADDQLTHDLARVGSQATELGLDPSKVKALDMQIEKITDLARSHSVANGGTGVIPGDAYQALTNNGSTLSKLQKSDDSAFADLASDIRSAVDDAVARGASPENVKALQNARFQWKNLKTLQPLAAKSTDGTISPALLKGRVMAQFPNFAFGSGGDLGDLARIGQTFMKEPGNSQTTPRLMNALKSAALPAFLGGEGMSLALHDPLMAAKLAGTAALATGAHYAGNAVSGVLNNNPLATASVLSRAGPSPVSQGVNALVKNAGGGVGIGGRNALTPMPVPPRY